MTTLTTSELQILEVLEREFDEVFCLWADSKLLSKATGTMTSGCTFTVQARGVATHFTRVRDGKQFFTQDPVFPVRLRPDDIVSVQEFREQ